MPRSEQKKPVGFATHITAGGIAGAMEAVSGQFVWTVSSNGRRDGMLSRAVDSRQTDSEEFFGDTLLCWLRIFPERRKRFASFEAVVGSANYPRGDRNAMVRRRFIVRTSSSGNHTLLLDHEHAVPLAIQNLLVSFTRIY